MSKRFGNRFNAPKKLNHCPPQGIMYLFNPPLALYLAKHPHHRPRSMWLGIILITAGLIGAAFASQAWVLILCQGVLYAIGGSKSRENMCREHKTDTQPLSSLPVLPSHCLHASIFSSAIENFVAYFETFCRFEWWQRRRGLASGILFSGTGEHERRSVSDLLGLIGHCRAGRSRRSLHR